MSVAPPPGPPNVRRMLDAVRGGDAVPPSVSTMLDAVRGDQSDSSPASVASMIAEVRGGAASMSPPSTVAMLAAIREAPVRSKRKWTASTAVAKAPAKKRSVADILAAARAADGDGAGPKTTATPSAKPAGGRPSVADILAKARGKAVANPKSGEQSFQLDRKADAPAPIPLSVAEMVRELRARERAVMVPAKPRRSVGGWFARVFGSRA